MPNFCRDWTIPTFDCRQQLDLEKGKRSINPTFKALS